MARGLLQDLRYSLRLLVKSKGFLAVAVITLSLGIGGSTAIFNLLNTLLLCDLPVREPGRLVSITRVKKSGSSEGLLVSQLEAIKRYQQVFSGLFGWWGPIVQTTEINGAVSAHLVVEVTGDYYSVLGIRPLLGRFITGQDISIRSGRKSHVAVISYAFWRSQYGSSNPVGKILDLGQTPFTVIGVEPKSFRGLHLAGQADVTVPLMKFSASSRLTGVVARLRHGVSVDQARAQIRLLWPSIRAATLPPKFKAEQRQNFLAEHLEITSAASGFSYLRKRFSEPLYVLLGITGLLLLLVCANLATLMLARASARQHEIGVRVALGATRWQLQRQLLMDNLLLCSAGAIFGLALAWWASQWLADLIAKELYFLPTRLTLTPDLRVIEFTIAAAVVTAILSGIAPIWRATRQDPSRILQQSASVIAGTLGDLGKWLIIMQVAVSFVLLVGAALFVRSLVNLQSLDLGFRSRGVVLALLQPVPGGYNHLNIESYYRDLMGRLLSVPGVHAVSLSNMPPGSNGEWAEPVVPTIRAQTPTEADLQVVSPGFFRTLDINLLQGRDFSWQDNDHSPRVAILNKALARTLFGRENAIGQHIRVGGNPKRQDIRIVGIVSNAKLWKIRAARHPTVFLSCFQESDYAEQPFVEIRAAGQSRTIRATVRRVVKSLGHEYILTAVSLKRRVEQSILTERLTAIVAAFFGALALLIATVGLYGLMAYAVTRRKHEIGIRMAIGAHPSAILTMIIRETLTLVVAGLAIGVPCAVGVVRLVSHLLFGLTANDPATLVTVCAVMLVVGTLAGFFPALRAARVNPMVCLRYE